jgi:hypothetical protein
MKNGKETKTKQKFENYFFSATKKKQVKCANKYTNITNKQATNKMCTLKIYITNSK